MRIVTGYHVRTAAGDGYYKVRQASAPRLGAEFCRATAGCGRSHRRRRRPHRRSYRLARSRAASPHARAMNPYRSRGTVRLETVNTWTSGSSLPRGHQLDVLEQERLRRADLGRPRLLLVGTIRGSRSRAVCAWLDRIASTPWVPSRADEAVVLRRRAAGAARSPRARDTQSRSPLQCASRSSPARCPRGAPLQPAASRRPARS